MGLDFCVFVINHVRTWKIPKDITSSVVFEAIKIGVRHLDCACDYGNEIGNKSEFLVQLEITSLMVPQRSVWGSNEVLMKVIKACCRDFAATNLKICCQVW